MKPVLPSSYPTVRNDGPSSLIGYKRLGENSMDVAKILVELKQEREQIEEAILSLERLARGRGRRRGRPPSWMAEITTKRRGRPPGSKNKPTLKSMGATSIG